MFEKRVAAGGQGGVDGGERQDGGPHSYLGTGQGTLWQPSGPRLLSRVRRERIRDGADQGGDLEGASGSPCPALRTFAFTGIAVSSEAHTPLPPRPPLPLPHHGPEMHTLTMPGWLVGASLRPWEAHEWGRNHLEATGRGVVGSVWVSSLQAGPVWGPCHRVLHGAWGSACDSCPVATVIAHPTRSSRQKVPTVRCAPRHQIPSSPLGGHSCAVCFHN